MGRQPGRQPVQCCHEQPVAGLATEMVLGYMIGAPHLSCTWGVNRMQAVCCGRKSVPARLLACNGSFAASSHNSADNNEDVRRLMSGSNVLSVFQPPVVFFHQHSHPPNADLSTWFSPWHWYRVHAKRSQILVDEIECRISLCVGAPPPHSKRSASALVASLIVRL